jgi:hypothetical protein
MKVAYTILLICFVSALANASDPSEVFQRYEDVFNRYDADAVASFWVLKPEEAHVKLGIWKGYREFEAATHAVFDISWKSLGQDAFEVTQREDCDFYRELGSGTKISTFTIHLRDGKFHDVQRGTSTDTGRNYDLALNELKTWIVKNHPDEATIVIKDDDFLFNKSTAESIMKLVREWRKSKAY